MTYIKLCSVWLSSVYFINSKQNKPRHLSLQQFFLGVPIFKSSLSLHTEVIYLTYTPCTFSTRRHGVISLLVFLSCRIKSFEFTRPSSLGFGSEAHGSLYLQIALLIWDIVWFKHYVCAKLLSSSFTCTLHTRDDLQ